MYHRRLILCIYLLLAQCFFSFASWAQTNTAEYRDRVQTMYVAYYGRPGDSAGLDYWAARLLQNSGDMNAIIDSFGNSSEFLENFGSLSHEDLVNNVYQQLFNRNAEAGGLQFYAENLANQTMTLASIALNVADGASSDTADGVSRDNKVLEANKFSHRVSEAKLHYGSIEIAYAKQFLNQINANSTDDSQLTQTLSLLIPYNNEDVYMSTNFGDVVLRLFHEEAPLTVANFLAYIDVYFYDALLFHRVSTDFVIQGGGFDNRGVSLNTYDPIELEVDAGLSNTRGTLAMARTSDPDSATSQFFINLVDNLFLDASNSNDGYAVFGEVISGLDVVDTIGALETAAFGSFPELPVEMVQINFIRRIAPALLEREINLNSNNVDRLFVNAYESQYAYGNSQVFYTLAEQNTVVSIVIDNHSTNFSPVVSIVLFEADVSEADMAHWINNQHSDALYSDVPEPLVSYVLSPESITVNQTPRGSHSSGAIGDEYDMYAVGFTIAEKVIERRFQLSAFTVSIDVQVLVVDPLEQ